MAPVATEAVPMIFGQCTMDSHEGAPAVNSKGQHFQECPGSVKDNYAQKVWPCACWCHAVAAKARELAGEEPSPDITAIGALADVERSLSEPTHIDAPVVTETKIIRPPVHPPTFQPTPSGRKAKGQLEQEVLEACNAWIQLATGQCTAVFIASWIDAQDPPSTGAITAVLERWKEMGFAYMEKGPIRFTGFTVEGERLGLYNFKEKHRRMAKSQSNRIKRGF